jgi:hypothetical protein
VQFILPELKMSTSFLINRCFVNTGQGEQKMLLRVLYKKGFYDFVKPEVLNRLIETEQIDRFYRKSGEVNLGIDTIRSAHQKESYTGIERRNILND